MKIQAVEIVGTLLSGPNEVQQKVIELLGVAIEVENRENNLNLIKELSDTVFSVNQADLFHEEFIGAQTVAITEMEYIN